MTEGRGLYCSSIGTDQLSETKGKGSVRPGARGARAGDDEEGGHEAM